MRKLSLRTMVCGVVATALLAAGPAGATQRCAANSEQQVFDLQALKSELMVLSVTCHTDTQYNAFVHRYQTSLADNERQLAEYFRHAYGRRSQGEQDSYVTTMANEQANYGLKQGSDFCPRNMALFEETMALDSESELPMYAAAKALFPPSLAACVTTAAATTSAPEHTNKHGGTRRASK